MRRAILFVLVLVVVACSGWKQLRAQQEPAAKQPNLAIEERKVLMKTIGLLSASQVYQAYLNVGLIADGKANGHYSAQQAQEILRTVQDLLVASDRQLEKISLLEVTKTDREALLTLRRLSAAVRQQSDDIQVFWATGNPQRGASYEKHRQEAWQGLSKLLGMAQ